MDDHVQTQTAPEDSTGAFEHASEAMKRTWPGEYFSHVPHPHIAARHSEGPVKVADQLPKGSPIARFNSRFALIITVAVGSMWAAYLFTVLAFVSFPSAIASGDKIIIVAWIAQTFLQLVLLPVIIVGQNIQGAASDKRAEQTYKDAEAVLHESIQIEEHLCMQDVKLHEQMQTLRELIEGLARAFPAAAPDLPAAGSGPSGS
jgi:hypothetical protein